MGNKKFSPHFCRDHFATDFAHPLFIFQLVSSSANYLLVMLDHQFMRGRILYSALSAFCKLILFMNLAHFKQPRIQTMKIRLLCLIFITLFLSACVSSKSCKLSQNSQVTAELAKQKYGPNSAARARKNIVIK